MSISHDDRCVVEAEVLVWAAIQLLGPDNMENGGAWQQRINAAAADLRAIAAEMRTHNDQHEDDE